MHRIWRAKWISHPHTLKYVDKTPLTEEGERNIYYLFRKEVDVTEQLTGAELCISGSTWYRLYINGIFVEHGPVQSPVYRKYYNRRAVKDFLVKGRNVLAVELQVTGKSFQGALLVELRNQDGETIEASSGEWRCLRGNAWKSNTHFFSPSCYCPWQEIFDARKMPGGWLEPGFDDSGWNAAAVNVSHRGSDIPPSVAPWLEMVERDIPYLEAKDFYPQGIIELSEHIHIRSPYRDREDMSISLSATGKELEKCSIENVEGLCNGSGSCIVTNGGTGYGGEVYDPGIVLDFGKIIRAFSEVNIEGPEGTRIEIGYVEDLVDGHFNNAIGCVFADCIYLKEGVNHFRSFMWKSFRYVKLRISGVPPCKVKVNYIKAVSELYPFEFRAGFDCSDKRLGKVYDMCEYTIDLCTADNIFDTPFREQGQWMYDISGVILGGLLWAFGEQKMTRKYLKMTAHALLPTGTFSHVSNMTNMWWKTYTDCGLHFTRAMWEYYQFSGDDSLIFECYPQLMMNMDFFTKYVNDDGLIENEPSVFLDWAYNFSEDARNGISAPLNALYYWILEYEEKICRHYGDDYRLERISSARKKLADSFLECFWDDGKGCLIDSIINGEKSAAVSEYAHALAILSGLLAGDKMNRAIENVFENRQTEALEAEPFACFFVLKALAVANRFDLALGMIKDRWGKRWADVGYTSTPENWALNYYNGDFSTPHSHSHAWSAGPCEILTTDLLGIDILEAGFKKIRIQPRSTSLEYDVKINTPHGILHAVCKEKDWKYNIPDSIEIIK